MNSYVTDTVNYTLPLENIIDGLEDIDYTIATCRVHYPDRVVTYNCEDLLSFDLLSVVMEKHMIRVIEPRVVDLDAWVKVV